MISFKTCIELIHVLDGYNNQVIDRIFYVFGIDDLIHPANGRITTSDKINKLLIHLKYPPLKGPFSESVRMDLLQYLVDHYYRYLNNPLKEDTYIESKNMYVRYEDLFTYYHLPLCNSLKLDGFSVHANVIKKSLPSEIQEAKTENELFTLLNKYGFLVAKGHLEQARNNHAQGNWAGANAQFRPFVESLLISICSIILPSNNCNTASAAIKLLGSTANPPFLLSTLNEIDNNNCRTPYVEGLWKRLHPAGVHPGLSDNEDSTFRYHTSIVFAHYLLKRLEKRI